jgi:hypothetical protein
MYRLCLAIGFGLALVWTFGCGQAPNAAAPAASVKGTVNIDGKPVPTGELHFGMEGVPPRVLQIKDGTFSGEAPIGKNQVELYIWVEGPESKPGRPSKNNVAPARYWGPKTILAAEVKAGGSNEFKFDITSK